MKKTFIGCVILACGLFLINLSAQNFTYGGADKCKICHKSEKQGQQHPLWEAGKHSKTFEVLSSEKAAAIGKEKGVNPTESPECLKCHTPLYEKAPEIKAEGVTCEVCHGPGSEYKKMSVMKDHAESVKSGLIEYKSAADIKAQCLKCHENAHGKSFNFEESWEKIKHPVPEK